MRVAGGLSFCSDFVIIPFITEKSVWGGAVFDSFKSQRIVSWR